MNRRNSAYVAIPQDMEVVKEIVKFLKIMRDNGWVNCWSLRECVWEEHVDPKGLAFKISGVGVFGVSVIGSLERVSSGAKITHASTPIVSVVQRVYVDDGWRFIVADRKGHLPKKKTCYEGWQERHNHRTSLFLEDDIHRYNYVGWHPVDRAVLDVNTEDEVAMYQWFQEHAFSVDVSIDSQEADDWRVPSRGDTW